MATNIQKEHHFNALHDRALNPAEIKPLGTQSVQIILKCGCKQTQHFYCGKPSVKKEHPNYDELLSKRHQYFEFCPKHVHDNMYNYPLEREPIIIESRSGDYKGALSPKRPQS